MNSEQVARHAEITRTIIALTDRAEEVADATDRDLYSHTSRLLSELLDTISYLERELKSLNS